MHSEVVPYSVDGQVFAHVLDGWATSHIVASGVSITGTYSTRHAADIICCSLLQS